MIHALSITLFGRSLAIQDFPERPDIIGAGLSDWDGYADRLARKLGYINTFYHQPPWLDITDVHSSQHNQYDFIISSDVFEHICPPISTAFRNACDLLRPGGSMIFTVPYLHGETREHFPEVREFSVQQEGKDWILLGYGSDGQKTKFTGLTFHGGPGTVVEFRVFGEASLRQDCANAGFRPARVFAEAVPEFGIYWNRYIAEEAPYRPSIYGLDTPPWALAKGTSVTGSEDMGEEVNAEEATPIA